MAIKAKAAKTKAGAKDKSVQEAAASPQDAGAKSASTEEAVSPQKADNKTEPTQEATASPQESGVKAESTQEAAASAQYAGFWRRLGSGVIDGALMLVAGIILVIILRHGFGSGRHPIGNAIFWLIVPWLYWALLESSSAQGTLGKMALGIIVTDGAGKRVSFARATGRHFAKIISSLILLIGFIMIAFTKKKQGLHDIIADCLVVKK